MTVWETSFSAVSDQLPEAGRLLKLLAFIHYEDIFIELFRVATGRRVYVEVTVKRRKGCGRPNVRQCFAILKRCSLLSGSPSGASCSMYRLVHAWSHDRLLNVTKDVYLFYVAALVKLCDAIHLSIGPPAAKLRLMPPLRANFERIGSMQVDKKDDLMGLSDILAYAGGFAAGIGRWNNAGATKLEVLNRRTQILSAEDPDTIVAMTNFVNTLGDQGQLEEAATIMWEVCCTWSID
jgi:hypothetical protein